MKRLYIAEQIIKRGQFQQFFPNDNKNRRQHALQRKKDGGNTPPDNLKQCKEHNSEEEVPVIGRFFEGVII